MCRDTTVLHHPDFGIDLHKSITFDVCSQMDIFRKKGSKIKLQRWQSWFKRVREVLPQRSAYLMIFVRIGLLRGWWSTVQAALPYFPMIDKPDSYNNSNSSSGDRSTPKADEGPMRMREADKELQQKQQGFRNTMHFAANVLADTFNMRKLEYCFA